MNLEEKRLPGKHMLLNLYHNKNFSIHDIANSYKTYDEKVRRLMKKYHIQRRERYLKKYNIPKEKLEHLYNTKKLSTIQIAKSYNCSQWLIWNYLRKYNIEPRNANDYHKWKNPGNTLNPILNNSPELSYIIAVIWGDGWVYKNKNTCHISLEVKDKIFCEEFSYSLRKIGLNSKVIKNKRFWRAIAVSKIFYEWYNKLRLEDIRNIALMYPKEFIRGFYESEGCVANGDKKYNYKYVIIVNTKKDYIELLKNLLENLDFNPNLYLRKTKPPRKPLWVLSLFSQKEVRRFFNVISPCIKKLD